MKKAFLILFLFYISLDCSAQYTINGNASQNNCHCYTLTNNFLDQKGSVWNNNQIDLNQSFDFKFSVFLGCSDFNGADGIAFVLQPISLSVGSSGGGMGFQFISPSVGVTLDTYQNASPDNDPYYDHIAIQLNGDINHLSSNTLTPYTPISATSDDVEDCNNHSLSVVWNAPTKNIKVYFDNTLRLDATNDFVNNVFGGNSFVYWGFTGATGGLSNLQQFCTELSPSFQLLPTQKRCINEPIDFYDFTTSFSEPVTRFWDFGDGSPIVTNVVNPTHTYTTSGNKIVKLKVVSIDGCEETYTQSIHVGTKPVAAFSTSGTCVNTLIQFTNLSTNVDGAVNSWNWNLDNGGINTTLPNPSTTYTTSGIKNISLTVKTIDGCESDPLIRPISVQPRPIVDFSFTDYVCLGNPTLFQDLSTGGVMNYWNWTYSDSAFPATIQNPSHVFSTPGPHTVTLVTSATGNNSCAGSALTKTVYVADKPRAGMKHLTACQGQQVQLQDSSYTLDGLTMVSSWWDLGNGQFSNQFNPSVTYTLSGTKIIKHVVYNDKGCKSDTLVTNLSVGDKPIADFNFSTPVCNSNTISFNDQSLLTTGSITNWNWTNNGVSFGNTSSANGNFPFGNNTVGLTVTSSLGCVSDAVYKNFRLIKKPEVTIRFRDTCKYSPVLFSANESAPFIGINQWHWNFGDGQQSASQVSLHTYIANGDYAVQLYAISVEGCSSDTLKQIIHIYGTNAFAGNDTIAASMQPIQLNAIGGISYQWSPPSGLSATNIPNPVVTVSDNTTYYLKASTPSGCESYDTINIKIYKGPDIYIPSAFTPNNDGLNDYLKAFSVGLKQLDYFIVYNRYGQQVFYTNESYKGWDGKFKGIDQPSGTYIWIASGTDFLNKPIQKKGTVIIIR